MALFVVISRVLQYCRGYCVTSRLRVSLVPLTARCSMKVE